MSDVPSSNAKIQVESMRFRSATGESMLQSLGGSINWCLDHQVSANTIFFGGHVNQNATSTTGAGSLSIRSLSASTFEWDNFAITIQNSIASTVSVTVSITDPNGSPSTSYDLFTVTTPGTGALTGGGGNLFVPAGGSIHLLFAGGGTITYSYRLSGVEFIKDTV